MSKFVIRYIQNARTVLRSLNNPLKKPENIDEKDELEREFYDKIAEEHLHDFNEGLFRYDENEAFPKSHQYFYSKLEGLEGKSVLDVCCGYGFTSVKLAARGARVTGIDISPKMIELSRKNAEFNHLPARVDLRVMSAQKMDFADNQFDYVVGLGALHHLNLEAAGNEIFRVLKPRGKALFVEPRIPFKWLIILRSVIPAKCFESPGGSQLSDEEIKSFANLFSSHHVQYFLFLKKLCRFPFLKRFEGRFDRIDFHLVQKLPFLRRFYWAFVIEAEK